MDEKRVTYFVVLGFKPAKGRRHPLVADDPFEAQTPEAARRRAKRYAEAGGAGVAFSRSGVPALGVWDGAEILGQYGDLPEGVIEQATEAA